MRDRAAVRGLRLGVAADAAQVVGSHARCDAGERLETHRLLVLLEHALVRGFEGSGAAVLQQPVAQPLVKLLAVLEALDAVVQHAPGAPVDAEPVEELVVPVHLAVCAEWVAQQQGVRRVQVRQPRRRPVFQRSDGGLDRLPARFREDRHDGHRVPASVAGRQLLHGQLGVLVRLLRVARVVVGEREHRVGAPRLRAERLGLEGQAARVLIQVARGEASDARVERVDLLRFQRHGQRRLRELDARLRVFGSL